MVSFHDNTMKRIRPDIYEQRVGGQPTKQAETSEPGKVDPTSQAAVKLYTQANAKDAVLEASPRDSMVNPEDGEPASFEQYKLDQAKEFADVPVLKAAAQQGVRLGGNGVLPRQGGVTSSRSIHKTPLARMANNGAGPMDNLERARKHFEHAGKDLVEGVKELVEGGQDVVEDIKDGVADAVNKADEHLDDFRENAGREFKEFQADAQGLWGRFTRAVGKFFGGQQPGVDELRDAADFGNMNRDKVEKLADELPDAIRQAVRDIDEHLDSGPFTPAFELAVYLSVRGIEPKDLARKGSDEIRRASEMTGMTQEMIRDLAVNDVKRMDGFKDALPPALKTPVGKVAYFLLKTEADLKVVLPKAPQPAQKREGMDTELAALQKMLGEAGMPPPTR